MIQLLEKTPGWQHVFLCLVINGKSPQPSRTLLNLTPDQEIELEDEQLPSSLTSSSTLGKRSRDSEEEEEAYSLCSAQPVPARRHKFLHDVL